MKGEQQRAMLAIHDAAELAVLARCYHDVAVAEFERAWEWWEAELEDQQSQKRNAMAAQGGGGVKVFVAVDVACLECGGGELKTRVLGVYKSREEAEAQYKRSRRATESLWASYDFAVCESDIGEVKSA